MSITLKEIAKKAGVARATVDRAVNGRGGINPDTKQRILKIAKENGYEPNIIGKTLSGAKTKTKIAIILNCIDNDFFLEIERGLEVGYREFEKFGFEMVYRKLKGYDVNEQIKAIDDCLADNIKNIIITPIDSPVLTEKLNSLNDSVSIVAVNGDVDIKKTAYVGCDYFKSGQAAGKLVSIFNNRAKLLLVTGSLSMKGHKKRIDGIKSALKASDVKLVKVIENNDDEIISYNNVKAYLINNPETDFVTVTAGGVKGALKAVLEINPSIKVTTFDATPFIVENVLNGHILATVTQQPYEQGYLAYKVMCENLLGQRKDFDQNLLTEINIKIKENL